MMLHYLHVLPIFIDHQFIVFLVNLQAEHVSILELFLAPLLEKEEVTRKRNLIKLEFTELTHEG